MRRIPSLDGIRALSILLVLGGHAPRAEGFPEAWSGSLVFFFDGMLGVRIFFVLSGFLITHLLLREEQAAGRIHLGRFYERRALRILPVYFSFALVLAVLDATTALDVGRDRYLSLITFTKNTGAAGWHDGHLWSLAVEQQFYLLWPLLLLLLPDRRRLWAVIGLIALAAVLRVAFYAAHNLPWYFYSLPTNMDALMSGALAAMLAQARPGFVRSLVGFHPAWMRLLAVVLVVAVWQLTARARGGLFTVPFGPTVQCAAIAFLVISYAHATGGPVFRLLNLPLVRGLGVLSYSLYIWQQLCFVPEGDYAPVHPAFLHFPWNLGTALVLATASYFVIEQPFFNLRKRLRAPEQEGVGAPPKPGIRMV